MMNGANIGAGSGLTFLSMTTAFHVAGMGDFNGDQKADLLWRNSGTGDTIMWLMDGTNIIAGSGPVSTVPSPFTVAGIGDFDGMVSRHRLRNPTPRQLHHVDEWDSDSCRFRALPQIADANWGIGARGRL